MDDLTTPDTQSEQDYEPPKATDIEATHTPSISAAGTTTQDGAG